MTTNKVTRQDVFDVAKSLFMSLNSKQVTEILEMYESEQKSDPTATWDLVVENCIYVVLNNKS